MFTRPYLSCFTDDTNAGGGDGGNQPAFPANTPVKDMTPEQQAAYWQDKARKHEDRVKAFGEFTPDKVKALVQERDTLKAGVQTDADKALEAAREEGRSEVRAELHKERATNALDRALQGRVPNPTALLGLDVTTFVVNGQVDTDAVKAWVEDNSTEAVPQRRNPDVGQGNRGHAGGAGKTVTAGRDLFAERHKKKSTS